MTTSPPSTRTVFCPVEVNRMDRLRVQVLIAAGRACARPVHLAAAQPPLLRSLPRQRSSGLAPMAVPPATPVLKPASGSPAPTARGAGVSACSAADHLLLRLGQLRQAVLAERHLVQVHRVVEVRQVDQRLQLAQALLVVVANARGGHVAHLQQVRVAEDPLRRRGRRRHRAGDGVLVGQLVAPRPRPSGCGSRRGAARAAAGSRCSPSAPAWRCTPRCRGPGAPRSRRARSARRRRPSPWRRRPGAAPADAPSRSWRSWPPASAARPPGGPGGPG